MSRKILAGKWRILKVAGVILLCWLPILICLWPGTMINDSWRELKQDLQFLDGEWTFSSHHPVFDTILLGVGILPVALTTGKWHLAIFLFAIFQAIMTALAFSYSVIYAKEKLKVSKKVAKVMMAIYCFLPIFPLGVQTVGKDAIFSAAYVVWIVQFIEIVRTEARCLAEKKFFWRFIGITVLGVLTKKVGIFVMAGSLVFLAFGFREMWKKILLAVLVILGFGFVVMPVSERILHIQKGSSREMFSIMFQATGKLVSENEERIPEEEREVLAELFNYDDLREKYKPRNADPAKAAWRGENYGKYFKIWIKEGIKNPDVYAEAMGTMIFGWWSLAEYKPLTDMHHHDLLDTKYIPEWAAEKEEWAVGTTDFVNRVYDFLYNIPILGKVLSYGFWAGILPIVMLVVFKKKGRLVMVPMILSLIFGCYLSPISVGLEAIRYLYPVGWTAIITFVAGWKMKKNMVE